MLHIVAMLDFDFHFPREALRRRSTCKGLCPRRLGKRPWWLLHMLSRRRKNPAKALLNLSTVMMSPSIHHHHAPARTPHTTDAGHPCGAICIALHATCVGYKADSPMKRYPTERYPSTSELPLREPSTTIMMNALLSIGLVDYSGGMTLLQSLLPASCSSICSIQAQICCKIQPKTTFMWINLYHTGSEESLELDES